jgi:predicted nucleic acid-binding protein
MFWHSCTRRRLNWDRVKQPNLLSMMVVDTDVASREHLFAGSALTATERGDLLDALFSVCHWVEIYYLWRPNLPDERDNHLIELALAGGASAIVTRNIRDVTRGELKFPDLHILTPDQFLERFPCPP